MNKVQLQTLKGFRDFLPAQKRERDYIMAKIIATFQTFGFEPLETPTLEYASLLMGKYGEEADKLVYNFEDNAKRKVGLRYDQTVPTARVLAQYQNELPKFFRRYQVQNVFRAEKPQKGRYREFTQCDIDIFGSTSPLADAEILACTYAALKNIGFANIELKINDRQTLFAALEKYATAKVDVFSIIQSIDKLDKLPEKAVIDELTQKGLSPTKAAEALTSIQQASKSSNLTDIINQAINLGVPQEKLTFTASLARGLDYYTGMIFEINLADYSAGSCGGGGRYDQLIEQLGGVSIPAVGVAFGFDRIVEAAKKLNLIPEKNMGTQVLVANFGPATLEASLKTAQQLRAAQINTEVYLQADKLGKQFKLANNKNISWMVVIGEEEMAQQVISLKNMATGEQQSLTVEAAIKLISGKQSD